MLDLDYKDVAEKYGGNKQRIAEAAALGALGPEGPLLAVTAGMYIDRMRAAQMQEQAPQQTVAQQVLAPPAPVAPQAPAGLGAIAPQAPQQPMVGMAAGGMVPPYAAGGGLSDVPIPDTMFDEPSNGGFNDGYAGGGLVAFADGGSTYYGYSADNPLANAAAIDALFGAPETKYAREIEADLLRRRSPEYLKAQKRKDLGQMLAEAGFGMLSGTSPNALQNIGAALMPALASASARKRERSAEERDIQKGLADLEAGRNTAAAQRAARLMEAQGIAIRGQEAAAARTAAVDLEKLRHEGDVELERMRQTGRADLAALRGSGGGGGGGGGAAAKPLPKGESMKEMRSFRAAATEALANARDARTLDEKNEYYRQYQEARGAYNQLAAALGQPTMATARIAPKAGLNPRTNRPAPTSTGRSGAKPRSFPGTQAEWNAMTAAERGLFK